MNILLISPSTLRKPDLPPLGLLSIGTVLIKKGYHVKILDATAQSLSDEAIIQIANKYNPNLIGISTLIVNEKQSIQLAKKLKKHFDCPVIFGGPQSSCFPLEILRKEDSLDGIVIKEGEDTIVELCEVLNQRPEWNKVNGLIYRDENGKIISNQPRAPIESLDSLPMPDRSLVDLNLYHPIPSEYRSLPATSVVTSRGCPYSCTYCFDAGKLAQKYRRRSPLNVIDEIEHLTNKYGIREISFRDDEFVLNNKWIYSFCDLILSRKINITWSCYGRVANVSPKLLLAMKKAGCWSIVYGIESGNQELLDIIKKGFSIQQVRNAVKWTHEADIETRCSFMLALPGETPEMGWKTVDFAIELDVNYAQFFAINPLPGTPLYDNCQEYGTLNPNLNNYGISRPFRAPFVPYAYKNEQEILRLVKKGHRKFYFRPNYFLKVMKKIRGLEDIRKYWNGIKMVLEV